MNEGANQRARNGGGDRGDQSDPQAGQVRGEQGDPHDDAARKTSSLRVALDHLAIGQNVWSGDVEGPGDVGRKGGCSHQIAQDVSHRDRLDLGLDPARGHHGGKALGQIAHHLKGRRTGTEDDGGLQGRRWNARSEQDLADLFS